MEDLKSKPYGRVFVLEPACPAMIGALKELEDYDIILFTQESELVPAAGQNLPGLLLLSIHSKEDVARLAAILKALKRVIDKHLLRVIVLSAVVSPALETAFTILGCSDFLPFHTAIQTLAFKSKLYLRALGAKTVDAPERNYERRKEVATVQPEVLKITVKKTSRSLEAAGPVIFKANVPLSTEPKTNAVFADETAPNKDLHWHPDATESSAFEATIRHQQELNDGKNCLADASAAEPVVTFEEVPSADPTLVPSQEASQEGLFASVSEHPPHSLLPVDEAQTPTARERRETLSQSFSLDGSAFPESHDLPTLPSPTLPVNAERYPPTPIPSSVFAFFSPAKKALESDEDIRQVYAGGIRRVGKMTGSTAGAVIWLEASLGVYVIAYQDSNIGAPTSNDWLDTFRQTGASGQSYQHKNSIYATELITKSSLSDSHAPPPQRGLLVFKRPLRHRQYNTDEIALIRALSEEICQASESVRDFKSFLGAA